MEEPPDIENMVIKLESTLPICRVCLEVSMEYVEFEAALCVVNGHEITYSDGFREISSPVGDLPKNLPTNFCVNCATDLLNTYLFVKRVENANCILSRVKLFTDDAEQFADQKSNDCLSEVDADDENEKDESTTDPLEEHFNKFIDLDDNQNSLLDYIPHVETDTEVFYKKNLEYKGQSENDKLTTSSNDVSTFELVECGPEYTAEEDDVLTEEDDKKSSQNECDTEFVQHMHDEDSVNETNLSPCKSMGPKSTNTTANCNICNKTLKKWSLRHHMKRCHKTEKQLLCSACPKTFTISSDLKVHMKTHDKERKRNFICTICRKGFYEKQALGVHMMRHEGVREFQCEKCPKKFITKKSLEVHEFVHNRQNGRFICRYCSKRFPSRADLIVHERFHTGDYPYKCELCNKSYAVKSHFNYHMAKHKGVTYKCDQCDKEFMNRGSLTAHKLKHRDKMPHECPICNKGFPSPFKLNRHKNYCQQPK